MANPDPVPMLSDILEVIKKAVPAHLSDELKKQLEEGQNAIRNLVTASEKIQRLTSELTVANKIIENHTHISKREAELKTKEAEIAAKLQTLFVQEAVYNCKAEQVNGRLADMKEIVLAVFANSKFKHSVQESYSGSQNQPNGSSHSNYGNKTTNSESEG